MIDIGLILVLGILTAYNIYYLTYFKSRVKSLEKLTEQDLYYKLDAKLELLKYSALIIIAIAALFGVKEFNDLSSKYPDIKQLESNYSELSKEYERLVSTNSDLEESLIKLRES